MGVAGSVLAQTWNAALAVLGARDYNRQAAANPAPPTYRAPKTVKTEYQQRAEGVLAKRRKN